MSLGNLIKNNSYSGFAFRLVRFLLIVLLLDLAIGKTLRHYYFKEKFGRHYRATYAIEKTTADVLVFGSSRAYHHYAPDIIEDSLKQSCYNTGSPGQFLLYNYATLQAVLKRYTPKMIILDLSPGELKTGKQSYDRLASMLPYYKDHEEVRPIVNLRGPFEAYKNLSSVYPYNSAFLLIAGGNSESLKKKAGGEIKGFKPLSGVYKETTETREQAQYETDPVKTAYLVKFIEECQRSGTKIIAVCSPSTVKYEKEDVSIAQIEKITREHNVPFINFLNDSSFTSDDNLFDDRDHLNKKGAELFTSNVINKIIDSLKLR